MVRRVVSILAVVGLVAGALVLDATPAHAMPELSVKVTKVVVGDSPVGLTIFTVLLRCDQGNPVQFLFDFEGGMDSAAFPADGNCSVSEPGDGNADSTTFACDAVSDVTCNTSTTFSIDGGGAEVNITVTNTFAPPSAPEAEPAAAEPVEAAPTFTG